MEAILLTRYMPRYGMKTHPQGRYYEAEEVERELKKRNDKLQEAIDRINDILKQDDGQAYKEAEKFIDKLKA